MSFFEYLLGSIGTAVLLMIVMPFTFEHENPVLSFLVAAASVSLVLMPIIYFIVIYAFGGVLW